MIHDKLANFQLYNLGPLFSEALEFIKDCHELTEERKYQLSGEMYASIESYFTKTYERAAFESHQKYIDIQFTIKGAEKIAYSPTDNLEINRLYNKKADVTFYHAPEHFSSEVTNFEGFFTILFPNDAHMPGLSVTGFEKVKKGVVKVPVTATGHP